MTSEMPFFMAYADVSAGASDSPKPLGKNYLASSCVLARQLAARSVC